MEITPRYNIASTQEFLLLIGLYIFIQIIKQRFFEF